MKAKKSIKGKGTEELTVVNQEMVTLNDQLAIEKNYAEAIITTIPQPLLVLNKNLRVTLANEIFYEKFGINKKSTEGALIYELGNGQWNIPALRNLLENIIPEKQSFLGYEVDHYFEKIGHRNLRLNARELLREKGEKLILLVIEDITDLRVSAGKFEKSEKNFRQLADSLPPLVWQTDREGNQTFASARWKDFTGVDPNNADTFRQIVHPDDFEGILKAWKKCLSSGGTYKYEVRLKSKNNEYHWFQVDGQPIYDDQGIIEKWVGAYTDINVRKLAEEELKESEKRFRLAIAGSYQIVFSQDTEQRHTWIYNPLPGFKPEDILGKTDKDLHIPESADILTELKQSVLDTGIAFTGDVALQLNDQPAFYNMHIEAIKDDKEKITGIIGVATDITERKNSEERIKESEERFRKLSDDSPLFIFIIEPQPEAPVSYWNKTWLDYTGQTYKEALGRAWDGVIHPDDVDLVLFVYIAAFEKQQAYVIPPIRVKRHDGEYRWHNFQANPRYLSNGEFNGYVGVGFDIHDRIVAEKALIKSEKQFSTLVENMENLAWMADGDGWIYWYNQRWYQYTGTSLEEMEGWGWQKVHHPDHIDRVVDFVKIAWHKNEPFELTFPLRGADGEYRWFLTRCFPITNDDGKIIRWVGTNTDIDEQKKAEENFQNLADNTPMWVWMADENVNVTYANQDLLRYIGIEHYSQFTGHVWEKVVHPDEIKLIYENFEKSYAAQQPFELECRIKKASTGNYEWYYIKAVPHFVQNIFRGFIGTALNTQQQKDAINILEYRKALLEAHTQGHLDGVLLVDSGGKIISYNKRFIEIWNMPQHIVDAKDDNAALSFAMTQLVNPQQFIDKVKYLYENPTRTSIDELEFKDGKTVERYGYPVVGEEGTYYAWSWVFRDVTSQKEAEKIIRESEERFRVMAELLPEKVSYANPDGKVIYFNQNWMDYAGEKKLLNEGWGDIVHPDDLEETLKKWKLSLETGNDYEIEFRIANQKGEYRWHLNRAVAVLDSDGNISKWIGAATDIQKLKEDEQRKGDFLKMVSHELKTPVTSIKGYVQLLLSILKEQQEVASAFITPPLTRIDNQISRLGRLIAEMIDLSRLESGKLEMVKETFRLDELLQETVQDILFTNTGHTINISAIVEATVHGDRNRIGQVIINLVNNAIKYSPDNNSIEIWMNKTENNQVAVRIKDYGIGIEKEDQEKIFERFYRAGGETEKNYSGFGIGLFIASEIIQRHEGSIKVESEKDKGSIFTLILPVFSETK